MSLTGRPGDSRPIYQEIEKMYQELLNQWDAQRAYDDQFSSRGFAKQICTNASRAIFKPFSYTTFRKSMLKTAAFAIAAVEWIDRREQVEGPNMGE